MKDKTGGQAFPTQEGFSFKTGEAEQTEIEVKPGMTLLDYFAGKAMRAMLSKGEWDEEKLAGQSYIAAEAMLKEREKWME